MRCAIWLICLLFISGKLFAQVNTTTKAVKLPNTIDNSDKRKVEKAKKLLNKGDLLEGEKLLVKLRDENMNQAYFHAALIQVQKQILDKIALENPPDEEEGEYFLHGKENLKPEGNLGDNFIDNGLSRTLEEKEETVRNIRLARKDRRKLKKELQKAKEESKNTDSVQNPIDAAQAAIDKINAEQRRIDRAKEEKSKLDRKIAKNERDVFMIPYESYAVELIKNCRLATLKHERVDSASHYLRILLVDTLVYDTMLSMEQSEAMNDALDFYYSRDYIRAAKLFEPLADRHPDYFPAHHLLGNCYLNLGLDTPSYEKFIYLTLTFPERPEGFEGLSHYYLAKGKYTEAAACIIKAILIYPEDGYFAQLNNILKRTGKVLNTQWLRREVYPIGTNKKYEELIAREDSPWRYYQSAKSQLYSYADRNGILRSNEISTVRYLELFAWQEMLAEHEIVDTVFKDPKKQAEYLKKRNLEKEKEKKKKKINFPFARAMQKMGYLDCYVLISLFHHDLYDAFKDFVILNPDKTEKYFYILLNWEDEKFDKYRVKQEDKQKTEKKKKPKKTEKEKQKEK